VCCEEMLAPWPTPNLKDNPQSAVRDCLFNIFAATLYIGGCSSIRNLRTRHAVVTGSHLSRDVILPCRNLPKFWRNVVLSFSSNNNTVILKLETAGAFEAVTKFCQMYDVIS
jgi:hypothetical protein